MTEAVTATGARYPDFYIVGAAKSGTTSLFRYLAQHPSVFVPWKKEPHYFADPSVHGGREHCTLDAYLRLYEECPRDVRAGDGSTSYLPSRSSAARIKEVRPDARILIVLRNPVDRAYSHYWHQRVRFTEEMSFEEAIEDEPRRVEQGRPYGFLYVRTGLYYEQVVRFVDVFSRQVRIHLFDDLRSHPDTLFRDVLSFLGVESEGPVDTARIHHRSGPLRSETLGRLMDMPFPGKRKLARRWPQRMRSLKRAVTQRNVTRPPPMNPATRLRLTEVVRADVERLQELLGRDLSAWLDPRSQPGRRLDS